MKFRQPYTFRIDGQPDASIVGVSIDVQGAHCTFTAVDLERQTLHVDVIVPIDAAELALGTEPAPLSGGAPASGIVIPPRYKSGSAAHALSRILAFTWGHAVQLFVRPTSLIAETEEDRAVLAQLGTDRPLMRLGAQLSIISNKFETLTRELIQALLEREVGLALYNDALSHSRAIAQFREFWRVLEAAFVTDSRDLVARLAAFSPIKQLGFSPEHLQELMVLRGRASHAQSSSGLVEYERVNKLVSAKVELVRSLAELVLLTKKNWGSPDLAVHQLARPRSGVLAGGSPVFFIDSPPTERR